MTQRAAPLRIAIVASTWLVLLIAGASPAEAATWRAAAPAVPIVKHSAPLPPPVLRLEIRAVFARRPAPARVPPRVAQAKTRDSVKNGIIIGTIAGAAYGVTFVAVAGDELSTSGKAGVLWTSAAMGAGLGWLIDWLK